MVGKEEKEEQWNDEEKEKVKEIKNGSRGKEENCCHDNFYQNFGKFDGNDDKKY